MDCLTFHVADAEYAMDLLRIQEVSGRVQVTPVPGAPLAVRGVTSLRGNVVAVVDPAVPFRQRFTAVARHTGLVFVSTRFEGQPILIGLIVDSLGRILRLAPDEIAPSSSVGHLIGPVFLCGLAKIGNTLVPLLDPDALLSPEALSAPARPLQAGWGIAATPAAREPTLPPPDGTVARARQLVHERSGAISLPDPHPARRRPTAPRRLLPARASSTASRPQVHYQSAAVSRSLPPGVGARHFALPAIAATATAGLGLPPQAPVPRPPPVPGQRASHSVAPPAAPCRRLSGSVGWLVGAGAFLALLLAMSLSIGRCDRRGSLSSPPSRRPRVELSRSAGEAVEASAGTVRGPGRLQPVTSREESHSAAFGPAPARPTEALAVSALHEVRKGDSLWVLSRRYYGDPLLWRKIFAANRDQIADPDLICPRERLRIPRRP